MKQEMEISDWSGWKCFGGGIWHMKNSKGQKKAKREETRESKSGCHGKIEEEEWKD